VSSKGYERLVKLWRKPAMLLRTPGPRPHTDWLREVGESAGRWGRAKALRGTLPTRESRSGPQRNRLPQTAYRLPPTGTAVYYPCCCNRSPALLFCCKLSCSVAVIINPLLRYRYCTSHAFLFSCTTTTLLNHGPSVPTRNVPDPGHAWSCLVVPARFEAIGRILPRLLIPN
jgi:hypothetical protein